MSAFHLKEGFARWNYFLVATSYVIAFVVCLCGVLFMPNMEVNAARQLAFSTLAACGVFAMHYVRQAAYQIDETLIADTFFCQTGMAAATFYTYASPVPDAGYPRYLSLVIVAFGIVTCLVSTTMVSHAATLSRNKLVEMISVKQQLWKSKCDTSLAQQCPSRELIGHLHAALAQKEAVEATVQLQTEFTSVAAHELRTPLYTSTFLLRAHIQMRIADAANDIVVTGYVDLRKLDCTYVGYVALTTWCDSLAHAIGRGTKSIRRDCAACMPYHPAHHQQRPRLDPTRASERRIASAARLSGDSEVHHEPGRDHGGSRAEDQRRGRGTGAHH